MNGFLDKFHITQITSNPEQRLFELLLAWDSNELTKSLNSKEVDDKTKGHSKSAIHTISSSGRHFRSIPVAFENFYHYITSWEPLYIEELKEMLSSKFRQISNKNIRGGNISFVMNDGIIASNFVIDGKIFPKGHDGSLQHLDVILLTFSSPTINKGGWEINSSLLGFVTTGSCKQPQIIVCTKLWINFRDKFRSLNKLVPCDVNGKPNNSAANKRDGLYYKYKLSYTIIDNLRSSIREFIAMHQLSTGIPLLPHILANNIELNLARTPESSPSTPLSPKAKSHLLSEEATSNFETSMLHIPGITSTFNKYLKSKFNPSQLLAIMQSTTKKGFTLIQGPPGTGKTTTILGILNSIHIREHDNYYSNLLKTFLSHRGLDCHLHGDEKQWIELLTADAKHKPRILVVAPSNVAVDNIVERIIEKGFVDGTGKVYKPSMVRVGSGRSHRVLPVALDELVQKELQKELSLDAKKSLLEELNYNIYKLIPEAAKVQLFLLNLKKAFDAWNPLPRGWELRISQETTHPYWADHNMRLTCSVPPANHRELSSLSQGYKTLEELPAYQFYSKKFIDFLGQLDKLHSRRSHLQLLLQISSHSRDMISNSFSREAIENSIIDNAEILLTTINSCGHPSMESSEFCVTIVDEAVQCTEPSLLIALRKGCKQCVLVGDQNQLSATIYSPLVVQYNYQRSLFERLIDAGHSYLMLRTQYRMTPEISEFSSRMFYDSQLLDGSNVQQLNYLPPYISRNITSLPSNLNETFFEQQMKTFSTYQYYPILLPFIFFNLPHSQDTENELTLSKFNEIESHFCMKLLEFLAEELELYQKQIPTTKPLKLGSIGLITPYSDQLIQLQQLAKRLNMMASPASSSSSSNNSNPENENSDHSSNKNYNLDLEFNTVDGFQGKEKDMIIFSAVRANQEGNIGFLSDSRRMNVALTRGRYGVYIVGNASTLTNDPLWRDLVDYAKDRRAFINLPTHHIFSPRFSIRETILKHLSRFSLISDDVYYPLFDKMRELNQQKLEIIQQRKKRKREDQEEPLTIDNQQTVPPLPSAFDRNITNSYHEVLEDGEIIDEN